MNRHELSHYNYANECEVSIWNLPHLTGMYAHIIMLIYGNERHHNRYKPQPVVVWDVTGMPMDSSYANIC